MKSANYSPEKWDDELTAAQKQLVEEHSTILEFSPNETIIKQGIAASHILYLESGMVKLSISQQQRQTIFKIVPAQSFIGIMCSFVKKCFDFSAVAIKTCRVRLIDRNIFEQLIRENGNFAVRMVELMSLSTNKIVHDLVNLSQKNVDGALSTILLDLGRILKSRCYQIPFTRQELADIIGYSKESVINSMSSLQRDGIIRVSAKNLEIIDEERLERIGRHG